MKNNKILTKGRARKPAIDCSNSIKVLVELTRGKISEKRQPRFPGNSPFLTLQVDKRLRLFTNLQVRGKIL